MNHLMVESWFKEPGDRQSVHYFQSDWFNLPSSGCSEYETLFSLCNSINISRILKVVQLAAWVKAADLKLRHDAAGEGQESPPI